MNTQLINEPTISAIIAEVGSKGRFNILFWSSFASRMLGLPHAAGSA